MRSPLIYFYSGVKIPSYAYTTLKWAAAEWNGAVVLLTDAPPARKILGVRVEYFEGWFDSSAFEDYLAHCNFDVDFRSGFWAKTLLRLFVIEQYMREQNLNQLSHAELDVLLIGTSEVPAHLDGIGKGLFIPWVPGKYAIGSYLYVNSRDAFRALIDFTVSHPNFRNEMEILEQFLRTSPTQAFGLPTVDLLMEPEQTICQATNLITEGQVGGLFDAARGGQWVLGIDPKNSSSALQFNHYSQRKFEQFGRMNVKFYSFLTRRAVYIKVEEKKSKLFNLHVHSKSMNRASRSSLRWLDFRFANLPTKSFLRFNVRKIRSFRKLKVPVDRLYRFVKARI